MRLSHWSTTPLTSVHSTDADRRREIRGDKPAGLWVSVDGEDDWAAWCAAEEFGDIRGKIRHEVILTPDAHLLTLTTLTGLLGFTEDYGREIYPGARERGFVHAIDWQQVAERWQGIVIAPYQWSARLRPEMFWYYGWDCASGCIWDAAAVAEVRLWEPAESAEPAEPAEERTEARA